MVDSRVIKAIFLGEVWSKRSREGSLAHSTIRTQLLSSSSHFLL